MPFKLFECLNNQSKYVIFQNKQGLYSIDSIQQEWTLYNTEEMYPIVLVSNLYEIAVAGYKVYRLKRGHGIYTHHHVRKADLHQLGVQDAIKEQLTYVYNYSKALIGYYLISDFIIPLTQQDINHLKTSTDVHQHCKACEVGTQTVNRDLRVAYTFVSNSRHTISRPATKAKAAKGVILSRNRALLQEYGGHITIEKSWARSLLTRMNFVKRKGSSAAKLPPTDFDKVKGDYLERIKTVVFDNQITPQLVVNWDQTAIRLVPYSDWTIEEQGTNKISIKGLLMISVKLLLFWQLHYQKICYHLSCCIVVKQRDVTLISNFQRIGMSGILTTIGKMNHPYYVILTLFSIHTCKRSVKKWNCLTLKRHFLSWMYLKLIDVSKCFRSWQSAMSSLFLFLRTVPINYNHLT